MDENTKNIQFISNNAFIKRQVFAQFVRLANIFVFFIVFAFLFVQNNIAFSKSNIENAPITIHGIVKDSTNNSPLPFAIVKVFCKDTLAVSKICDENGIFELYLQENVTYRLDISLLGYKSRSIHISEPESVKGPLEILLQTGEITLNEIVINESKSLIEDKGDKLIYNAEADVSNSSGDASDLLRKVPLVMVDYNGNPSLKGGSVPKLLINGKPIVMSPSMALKQIPSSMISKIEVITAPSAKYDAEGSGGIINIITTKKIILGFNGLLNGSIGTINSHLVGNVGYQRKEFGVSGNFYGNWFNNRAAGYSALNNRLYDRILPVIGQTFHGDYTGSFNHGQISASYEKKSNSIVLEMTSSLQRLYTSLPTRSNFYFDEVNFQTLDRDVSSKSSSGSTNLSGAFTRKYQNPLKELNLLLSYGNNLNEYNYFFQQTFNNKFLLEQGNNPYDNHEFNFQMDFQAPSAKTKHLFETGVRTTNRYMKSTFSAKQDTTQHGIYFKPDDRTGEFKYAQTIQAVYFSDRVTISNRLHGRVGIRLEAVSNKILPSSSIYSDLDDRYLNLFPSVGITWNLSLEKVISFNYFYRTQRPSIAYLNPNFIQGDPGALKVGNPYLDPEFSHNFESAYSIYVGKNYFKFTSFLRRTNDFLSTISYVDSGIVVSKFDNVGSEQVLGANLWASLSISKAWTINTSSEIDFKRISSSEYHVKNKGFVSYANLTSTYRFNKKWSAQFFGAFYTPRILIQGTESSFSFSNFAVKYEFNKSKSTFSLSVDNPFKRRFKLKVNATIATYSYNDNTFFYNRGIRIMFSHRFGVGSGNTSKKIKNKGPDDLKKVKESTNFDPMGAGVPK